jgi:hypothetical protein
MNAKAPIEPKEAADSTSVDVPNPPAPPVVQAAPPVTEPVAAAPAPPHMLTEIAGLLRSEACGASAPVAASFMRLADACEVRVKELC